MEAVKKYLKSLTEACHFIYHAATLKVLSGCFIIIVFSLFVLPMLLIASINQLGQLNLEYLNLYNWLASVFLVFLLCSEINTGSD